MEKSDRSNETTELELEVRRGDYTVEWSRTHGLTWLWMTLWPVVVRWWHGSGFNNRKHGTTICGRVAWAIIGTGDITFVIAMGSWVDQWSLYHSKVAHGNEWMKSDDCVAGDDHRCARSTKHLAIVGESERRRRRTSIWSSAVDEKVYNITRQPQAKYLELSEGIYLTTILLPAVLYFVCWLYIFHGMSRDILSRWRSRLWQWSGNGPGTEINWYCWWKSGQWLADIEEDWRREKEGQMDALRISWTLQWGNIWALEEVLFVIPL